MNFEAFKESLSATRPPAGASVHVQALWYDARGDWQAAHNLVDDLSDVVACRVHAYLHRKEGDTWNADYWYAKAGKKRPASSLLQEWEELVYDLL